MVTAVDTSVLIDVIGVDPAHGDESRNALDACTRDGRVVVCAEVVAELASGIGSQDITMKILRALKVSFVSTEMEEAAFAGVVRSQKRDRSRITADYLIAAHAAAHADRLLTRDAGISTLGIDGLAVVSPLDVN